MKIPEPRVLPMACSKPAKTPKHSARHPNPNLHATAAAVFALLGGMPLPLQQIAAAANGIRPYALFFVQPEVF